MENGPASLLVHSGSGHHPEREGLSVAANFITSGAGRSRCRRRRLDGRRGLTRRRSRQARGVLRRERLDRRRWLEGRNLRRIAGRNRLARRGPGQTRGILRRERFDRRLTYARRAGIRIRLDLSPAIDGTGDGHVRSAGPADPVGGIRPDALIGSAGIIGPAGIIDPAGIICPDGISICPAGVVGSDHPVGLSGDGGERGDGIGADRCLGLRRHRTNQSDEGKGYVWSFHKKRGWKCGCAGGPRFRQ